MWNNTAGTHVQPALRACQQKVASAQGLKALRPSGGWNLHPNFPQACRPASLLPWDLTNIFCKDKAGQNASHFCWQPEWMESWLVPHCGGYRADALVAMVPKCTLPLLTSLHLYLQNSTDGELIFVLKVVSHALRAQESILLTWNAMSP